MPKSDRVSSLHRNSVSTASAAGGGTRTSSWSQQDDDLLIKSRAQGLNWNQIAPKHFPSKSANACRKRHERLMEKQNAEQWDGVRLDVLAEAYMEVRSEMWRILGAKVGEKWQLVEQKVCQAYLDLGKSSSRVLCIVLIGSIVHGEGTEEPHASVPPGTEEAGHIRNQRRQRSRHI